MAKFFLEPALADAQQLIRVARGSEHADLYVSGGTVSNVYSGEYIRANVAIKNGRIAYVGLSEQSIGPDTEVVDASGRYLCPGYIEVHSHPWEIYNPLELCRASLAMGTTTMFCDALLFAMIMDTDTLERCIVDLSTLPLKVFWGARSVPPNLAANENVKFATERVQHHLELPNVAGIFEITRWPMLMEGDQHLLECIATARKLGKRVDGHTPGCSYEKLNPVVAAGIDSCHEAIDAQQALDRLRLGLYTFLRHSSLREDLPELIRIVTEHRVHTSRLILTTDGSNPTFYADKGSVDYLADLAVEKGVDPMVALQMITLNPATYFYLDQYLGGIAPGRVADIVVNPRRDRFRPELVIANGRVVARDGALQVAFPAVNWSNYPLDQMRLPSGLRIRPEHVMVRAEDAGPTFPVVDLVSAVITRRRDVQLPVQDGFVRLDEDDGMLFISLLDRHGEWVTNGVIKGFARGIDGFASTYNTAGDVLVIGKSGAAMAMAANRAYELGGGIILVENGRIIYELPLELGGAMTLASFEVTVDRTRRLMGLLHERGYRHEDLTYTLLFLPSDALPEIRVTMAGLFDVKRRQALRPRRDIL